MCDLMNPTQADNLMISIIEKIVKEEYGGCDPSKDNPCILKAVVSDGKEGYGYPIIYIWVVGKWRQAGRTGFNGLPSNKAVTSAIQRIRTNTGTTFEGKEIMLQFIKFGVSADTLRG